MFQIRRQIWCCAKFVAQLDALALANVNGPMEPGIADAEHSGQNTLGAFSYNITSAGTECVTARRLDDVFLDPGVTRLDLAKLDVADAELRVLEDARNGVRELRPVLLFEVSRRGLRNMRSSSRELLEFIRSFRYDVYTFDVQTGVPAAANPGEFSDTMMASPIEQPIA